MPDYQITKLVQQIVLEGVTPAKVLAQDVGKPYTTLLREINPYDTGAKLGVETFWDILRITGNPEPLRYMAEAMGYKLVATDAPRSAEQPQFAKAEAQ
jgi:hypothetical protein